MATALHCPKSCHTLSVSPKFPAGCPTKITYIVESYEPQRNKVTRCAQPAFQEASYSVRCSKEKKQSRGSGQRECKVRGFLPPPKSGPCNGTRKVLYPMSCCHTLQGLQPCCHVPCKLHQYATLQHSMASAAVLDKCSRLGKATCLGLHSEPGPPVGLEGGWHL